MRRTLGCAILSALLISGCGGGSGGGSGGDPGGGSSTRPDPTAVQVKVSISRMISDIDRTTVINWQVWVEKNGLTVNSAVVNVNGKNVPRIIGFINGWYGLFDGEASFVPGQDYAVTVTVDGVSYTDTLNAPGGILLDPNGASASWTVASLYASVNVGPRFGSPTWSVPAGGMATLTSPQAVPPTAYPTTGDYLFYTWVGNHRLPAGAQVGYGYFASLRGYNTYFIVSDRRERLVTK